MTTNVTVTGTTATVTDNGDTVVVTAASSPAIGVAWGAITGTLDDQADLESALAGKAPSTAWYSSGAAFNYVDTPDSASFTVTDLDVAVKVALADWTPAALSSLVCKWYTDGQLSWQFYVNTTGVLGLRWCSDGLFANRITQESTVATGLTDGAAKWLRVTLDVNDGGVYKVAFYMGDDGTSWTQLGTTKTGGASTSIKDGTDSIMVGASYNNNMSTGKFYKFVMRDSIGGSVVASPDFTVPSDPRHRDAQGNVWTFQGSSYSWMVG